ncbi:MAG TPA: transglycosylase SLT domain-containing protein [Woeseiaceae bacterium]|nr:transglycosylase SLT domain-containing protein [Woeseiaceae bacterium]
MNCFGKLRCRRHAGAIAVALLSVACAAQEDAVLDARREAFRAVYPAVERGDWRPAAERQSLLEGYVLWPDLKAAWLRANLDVVDASEVHAFLERYGDLKPARELRYRFALQLAADGQWPAYLDVYRRYYNDMRMARLDCLAVQAGLLSDRDQVVEQATALWLVGRSQVDECDPVFDYLRSTGLLDGELSERRFELAVSARQFSLARYLAKSMDDEWLDRANRWISSGKNPQAFIEADADCDEGDEHREQLLYALERLADRDALLARDHWGRLRVRHRFAPDETASISRYIALSAAQQHEPEAFGMLAALGSEAADENVRAWQVRTALLARRWEDVIAVIRAMPAPEQRAEEWRYWLAVALRQSEHEAEALPILSALAGERSYFGFLAADELGNPYAFGHANTPADEASIAELARHPTLIRARELFHVGLESRGRSEWSEAVGNLDAGELLQAAVLAHRWGWHSQAIATVADLGHYDDLEIRYPLAYSEAFRDASEAAQIRGSWAYGVARSESLFMSDIRSHAGAVGLMQLMPTTGRRTAAQLELPYSGLATLTDPVSNIRLGTTYLASMLERFDRNVVLATAAYNAGPYKVEEWLPRSERLDARIWIENIPYDETRGFVRRVLFSDSVFHWRLTGRTSRLSAALDAIEPLVAPERLSRAATETAAGR